MTVKIIGLKDGKISLSMKALEEKEEEEEDIKVEIPKSENIGTSLGDLFKNIKLYSSRQAAMPLPRPFSTHNRQKDSGSYSSAVFFVSKIPSAHFPVRCSRTSLYILEIFFA